MVLEKLYDELKRIICDEDAVIACVGSPLRMDDQAGLIICDRLHEKGFKDIIKCEYGLENCLTEISSTGKKTLLVIDAVYSDKLSPGDIVVLDSEAIESGEYNLEPISTHNIPFKISLSLLKELVGVNKAYLLGIMVKSIDLGLEISIEIRKSIDKIVELLEEILSGCR